MKSPTLVSFEGRRRTPAAVHAMLIAVLLLFSACKGSSSEPTPQPTTAVVKLSTVGTLPAGEKIGAIEITIALAPGVSLKTTANPHEPDAGVVTATGAAINSLLAANYTSPTSTLSGKVKIGLITTSGFGTGEFATINGDIAAGKNPQASEFSAIISTITNLNGSTLSGLTPGLSVDIR